MTKKRMKAENNKKRSSWFGVNPQMKVIPNKKKENEKRKCRRKEF